MKRRHFLSLAACCLLGLLPGCSFPMTDNMQVEDLLRAPRLSGDYGALQSALNDWLGESAQLKYPMQGELLSPFLLQDLDGDGIVEIPTQPDEAGLLNLSQSRRMDFIVWMDYTSPEPEKSFGLLDEESSCYIELPAEWEGNLMLTDSAEGEEAVELRTVDEGKLVLTMRLVPSSESAAGWTRLGVVLKDQSYRLSRSLYRLN